MTSNLCLSPNAAYAPKASAPRTLGATIRTEIIAALSGLAIVASSVLAITMIAPVLAAALVKEEIRELEDLLARFGFDPGPVDGLFDGSTKAAIRAYQRLAMLPMTGLAGQPLLDELRDVVEASAWTNRTVTEPQVSIASKASGQDNNLAAPESATSSPSCGTATGTGNRYVVHMASLRDEDAAREEWSRLQSFFPKYLGDKQLILRSISLANQGDFVRVLAGPFEDRAVAQKLCETFAPYGQYCVVMKVTSGS